MDEQYIDMEQIIKDTVTNGYMFNTRHGTIGKVMNYDDTSDMYLYKDNLGDYHYEFGINIAGNRLESNWVETVSVTLRENVKSKMEEYGISALNKNSDLKSLIDILDELHDKLDNA